MRRGIEKKTKKSPGESLHSGNLNFRLHVVLRGCPDEKTTSSINLPLAVGEARSERNSESGSPAHVADADLRSPEHVLAPQSTCNEKPGNNKENIPPRGEPKSHACLILERHELFQTRH